MVSGVSFLSGSPPPLGFESAIPAGISLPYHSFSSLSLSACKTRRGSAVKVPADSSISSGRQAAGSWVAWKALLVVVLVAPLTRSCQPALTSLDSSFSMISSMALSSSTTSSASFRTLSSSLRTVTSSYLQCRAQLEHFIARHVASRAAVKCLSIAFFLSAFVTALSSSPGQIASGWAATGKRSPPTLLNGIPQALFHP